MKPTFSTFIMWVVTFVMGSWLLPEQKLRKDYPTTGPLLCRIFGAFFLLYLVLSVISNRRLHLFTWPQAYFHVLRQIRGMNIGVLLAFWISMVIQLCQRKFGKKTSVPPP
jgi:hypothetical protein